LEAVGRSLAGERERRDLRDRRPGERPVLHPLDRDGHADRRRLRRRRRRRGDAAVPTPRHRDLSQPASSAASRFLGVSFGDTLYHASATLPLASTRNAERTMPMNFLPYMLFSPHTPYA